MKQLDDMPVAGDDAGIGDHMPTRGLTVVPDPDRAIIVLPENVAVAVAVEVATPGNMPAAGHRASIGDRVRACGLAVIPDEYRTVVVAPQNIGVTFSLHIPNPPNIPTARDDPSPCLPL